VRNPALPQIAILAAIEDGTKRPDAGLTMLLARALDVTVEDLTG
jgi:hypothetical protein